MCTLFWWKGVRHKRTLHTFRIFFPMYSSVQGGRGCLKITFFSVRIIWMVPYMCSICHQTLINEFLKFVYIFLELNRIYFTRLLGEMNLFAFYIFLFWTIETLFVQKILFFSKNVLFQQLNISISFEDKIFWWFFYFCLKWFLNTK